MAELKLLAMDEKDMKVISAATQDAVMRVADIGFAKSERRFACLMNRYVWEDKTPGANGKRRRAALHFNHVETVSSNGINLDARDGILNLLAIEFTPKDAPAGEVKLIYAGGATVFLNVECLEAQLSDLGASWAATATPEHE
ncbi:hypothetical protein MNBD_ALPHA12-651 [hydrothermal vent metagenome]|uniref:DUF2948 domain-containing protein n=1 Tax=hydrothermal vent metagenome TaxID=652676 RepID=A0A3B0U4K0_9ZZZZ